jgi:hypothetical protein
MSSRPLSTAICHQRPCARSLALLGGPSGATPIHSVLSCAGFAPGAYLLRHGFLATSNATAFLGREHSIQRSSLRTNPCPALGRSDPCRRDDLPNALARDVVEIADLFEGQTRPIKVGHASLALKVFFAVVCVHAGDSRELDANVKQSVQ